MPLPSSAWAILRPWKSLRVCRCSFAPTRARPPIAPGTTTYPESLAYRLKNRILGPPKVSEQLTQERLANPVAIGVLAPDMISSSAYGTEEMLRIMVPIIGIGAFSMVIPITLAILW